jgi:acyl phosphate:glycerol-3-phosphate acyltransferase
MNETWIIIIIALSSYLLGSLSMARIVTKIVAPGTNLEDVYYPNPSGEDYHLRTVSATTASIKLGPKVGGMVALLDALKGVIPVLIIRFIFPDQFYHLIAGIFAVIGHNWSIFHRFSGGGGMSVSYGAFFAVDFLGTLISAFAGMLIGIIIFREIAIAFTSGPLLFIVWLIIFKGDWPHILFGTIINLIIILKLIPDFRYTIRNRDNRADISEVMDQTGMGRGMKKLMQWMGIDPGKKKQK